MSNLNVRSGFCLCGVRYESCSVSSLFYLLSDVFCEDHSLKARLKGKSKLGNKKQFCDTRKTGKSMTLVHNIVSFFCHLFQ